MWILSILLHGKAHTDQLTVAHHPDMPTTIHCLLTDHLERLSGKLRNSVTDSVSGMTALPPVAPAEPATAETARFQPI